MCSFVPRSVDDECSHRPLAVKAICALTVSLVCLLALAGLVVYDLRRTRPHAQAMIYDSEARQALLWAEHVRQWDQDQLDTEQAMVARAQQPYDPAEEWVPLSARTPPVSDRNALLALPMWSPSSSTPTRFAPEARQGDGPLVNFSAPTLAEWARGSQSGQGRPAPPLTEMHSVAHPESHHHAQ